MKKNCISCVLLLLVILVSSCNNRQLNEMSDEEIKTLLSDVIASEQSIDEAGMRYFSELSAENNNMISPADLHQRLQNGEDIFVLDIRREADYQAGHIETAQNIWWFDVGKELNKVPKDKRVVVTCYSGQSAAQVIGVLSVMGYDVSALTGGMNNGWIASGLPLVQD